MFQQLAQRRTSQMPLPTTEASGAMTDASKRRFEDAEFEVDTEPDWVVGSSFVEPVGGTEDLATKALLPAGVASFTFARKTSSSVTLVRGIAVIDIEVTIYKLKHDGSTATQLRNYYPSVRCRFTLERVSWDIL